VALPIDFQKNGADQWRCIFCTHARNTVSESMLTAKHQHDQQQTARANIANAYGRKIFQPDLGDSPLDFTLGSPLLTTKR
jgi:hypothetical protein